MLTITKFYFVFKGNCLVIINDFFISHDQPAFCLESQRVAVVIREPNSKQQVTEGAGDKLRAFFFLLLLQFVSSCVFYYSLSVFQCLHIGSVNTFRNTLRAWHCLQMLAFGDFS